jgi:hypothetical protein
MRLHACGFLNIDVATGPSELTGTPKEIMEATAKERCRPESAPERGAFTFVRTSSFSESPVESDWLAGLNGRRFFLGRAER